MSTSVTFVFRTNLDSRTVEVMSRTMRNAMRIASLKLGVNTCNLVFVAIKELEPKLFPNAA